MLEYMASSPALADVTDEAMGEVLEEIDRDNGLSVYELAERTGYSQSHVQQILAALMERGKITSTPNWLYRESRRTEA